MKLQRLFLGRKRKRTKNGLAKTPGKSLMTGVVLRTKSTVLNQRESENQERKKMFRNAMTNNLAEEAETAANRTYIKSLYSITREPSQNKKSSVYCV